MPNDQLKIDILLVHLIFFNGSCKIYFPFIDMYKIKVTFHRV